jgi:hypothetical protein
MVDAILGDGCRNISSVISSSMQRGINSNLAKVVETSCRKSGSTNSAADVFRFMRSAGFAHWCSYLARCSHASRITHRSICRITPISFAMGMKSAGTIGPRRMALSYEGLKALSELVTGSMMADRQGETHRH